MRGNGHKLTVFVPMDVSSHPYLHLLYSTISEYTKVIDVKDKGNFIYKLKFIFQSNIIHIHWVEYFIRSSKGLMQTLIKFSTYLLFFIFMKYILNKKIIITLHNLKPHEVLYPKLEYTGFLIYLKLADAIIVHNLWSKRKASKIYEIWQEKIYVIPHGNFIKFYPNKISKTDARKKLGIPADAFVILYFGKIREYKGLDVLLSVFEDIKSNKLWVIIAGKPESDRMKKKLLNFNKKFENCILRLEYISDDEIQVYINACDIGILPYKEITTSGTLLLFASFKRTVIVPELEPISEIMRDTVIYFRSSKDLKSVIINLMVNNKKLRKMSVKIYKIALKYNWEEIGVKTWQLYQEVTR